MHFGILHSPKSVVFELCAPSIECEGDRCRHMVMIMQHARANVCVDQCQLFATAVVVNRCTFSDFQTCHACFRPVKGLILVSSAVICEDLTDESLHQTSSFPNTQTPQYQLQATALRIRPLLSFQVMLPPSVQQCVHKVIPECAHSVKLLTMTPSF